jgi:hypothetical protein
VLSEQQVWRVSQLFGRRLSALSAQEERQIVSGIVSPSATADRFHFGWVVLLGAAGRWVIGMGFELREPPTEWVVVPNRPRSMSTW